MLGPTEAGAQVLSPHKISQITGDARGNIEQTFNLIDPAYNDPFVVDADDINLDGTTDLVLETNGNDGWILFLNEDGSVKNYYKNSRFSDRVLPLRDFDGDGVPDVASGDEILYLNMDGTVKSTQYVAGLNIVSTKVSVDVNKDGVPDIVQIPWPPGSQPKIITISFLRADGTIDRTQRICNYQNADGSGCDEGNLSRQNDSNWGDVTVLDDLDGDNVPDLAVGAPFGALSTGVIWILLLNHDGTVKKDHLIDPTEDWFSGEVSDTLFFGRSVAGLGDLNGDGVQDLAVGADRDDDGGRNRGAVWVLFLNKDGSVKNQQKISSFEGGFDGQLHDGDRFGNRLLPVDIDRDGVRELIVAAPEDEGNAGSSGAWWILWLDEGGSVQKHRKVVATDFLLLFENEDHFGSAQASPGDLDGDGFADLAVGAPGQDDGGVDRGVVWMLFLNADGKTIRHQKISDTKGAFTGTLHDGDHFGSAVTNFADSEGVSGLVVGAPGDDDGGIDRGAVFVLDLKPDGTVSSHQKISSTTGNFSGALNDADAFGSAVASPGDLNGDGNMDLVVGAPGDIGRGAVWILFLEKNGSVKGHKKITTGENGFAGTLAEGDRFGGTVYGPGDLDGDGNMDLVVGAPGDFGRGAVWLLFLDRYGNVKGHKKITTSENGFSGLLDVEDRFGSAVTDLGDLDGDGLSELLVGAEGDRGGYGGAYILFLNTNGTVKNWLKMSSDESPFADRIDVGDRFGSSMTRLDDFAGDEFPRLVAGAENDDDGGPERGAVWVVSIEQVLSPQISEPTWSPSQVARGDEVYLSTRITDILGVTDVTVSYRVSGWNQFATADMRRTDQDEYTFTVPGWDVTERGLEFFITAENDIGGTTRLPSTGVVSVPVYLPDGLEATLISGSEASAYGLFSVPLELDEKSARVVLEDDLGVYNKARWRFFDVKEGSAALLELDMRDVELNPGKAFWLIVKDPGRTITTGTGTSVPTDLAYVIPLHEGWNVMGNPFYFPLPVTKLSLNSGGEIPPLRSYEGAWNDIFETPVDTLVPFRGYALKMPESDTLLVNPDLSATDQSVLEQRAGYVSEDAVLWSIRIRARHGDARDIDNVAVAAAGASIDWDPMDHPEPPVIGDYVSVSFPHDGWAVNKGYYSSDARPVPEEGEHWIFEVKTRRAGPVGLSFEDLAIPKDFEVWLVDSLLHTQQDLRVQPHYTVASSGEGSVRRLTLVAGKADFIRGLQIASPDLPQRYTILQNFPNPFSRLTTLRYALPERSSVHLVIYDVLGRQIVSLVKGEAPAGYHAVVWDGWSDAGMEAASGVYFARMQVGSYVETRKMVMIR